MNKTEKTAKVMRDLFKDRLTNLLSLGMLGVVLVLIVLPDGSLGSNITIAVSIVAFLLLLGRGAIVVRSSLRSKDTGEAEQEPLMTSARELVWEAIGTIVWLSLLLILGKPTKPYITVMFIAVILIIVIFTIAGYRRANKLNQKQ